MARAGLLAAERWTVRLAPALGMAAIAASALFMTESEARWAKIYAGPTDQPGPVAWRVEVRRGTPARPDAAHLVLHAVFGTHSEIAREFSVNDDGLAWIDVERPARATPGPVAVTLREGSRVLASGSFVVSTQRWLAGQRTEGGWCSGHHTGEGDIKVGVVDGVALHATATRVVVLLSKEGLALPLQRMTVEADGADIVNAARGRLELVTDTHGVAEFSVKPIDMAATLSISAPSIASFFGALPVRAGGFRVERSGDTLIVTSPVGHEHATLGLLTNAGLLDVETLELKASGRASTGTRTVARWPEPPVWVMVSAEPELDAGNTIGWPMLGGAATTEAHPSRVIPNVLVLDGYASVARRLQRERHRAWMTSSGALSILALLLTWAIVQSNRRQRRQVALVNRLLANEGARDVSERIPYALIAVLVLTAAIVALAWWTTLGS